MPKSKAEDKTADYTVIWHSKTWSDGIWRVDGEVIRESGSIQCGGGFEGPKDMDDAELKARLAAEYPA